MRLIPAPALFKPLPSFASLASSLNRRPRRVRDFVKETVRGIGLKRRLRPWLHKTSSNSARDSLRLVREAFRIEATTFRLDRVNARRAINPYVDRAEFWLRNLPSVHVQLSRVLFILGRSGVLLGIGEALRDQYAPVEAQLPGRLAMLLEQLEEEGPRERASPAIWDDDAARRQSAADG